MDQRLIKHSEEHAWTEGYGQDLAECVDWRNYGYK